MFAYKFNNKKHRGYVGHKLSFVVSNLHPPPPPTVRWGETGCSLLSPPTFIYHYLFLQNDNKLHDVASCKNDVTVFIKAISRSEKGMGENCYRYIYCLSVNLQFDGYVYVYLYLFNMLDRSPVDALVEVSIPLGHCIICKAVRGYGY